MTLFSVKYKIENAMNPAQCRQGDEFELEVPGHTRLLAFIVCTRQLVSSRWPSRSTYTFLVK